MGGSCPSPILQWALAALHSLWCVLFSSLFITHFFVFFIPGQGSDCPGIYAGFIPGVAVGVLHAAYLLTYWSNLPGRLGAGIWWCRSPPLFSVYCGMEKLCAGWGFGMSEFCFFLVVFPAKCGSSISARFLLYGAHTICFLPLVTILDPPELCLFLTFLHVQFELRNMLLF
jgi:hypothetical protein